jgi:hypothetical protein
LFASYPYSDGNFPCDRTCILQVEGDYVRVTGLRVRGQSRSTDTLPFKTNGIWIDYPGIFASPPAPFNNLASVTEFIATIDHNDMSDWMDAAITANSPFTDSPKTGGACSYPGFSDPNGMPAADFYPCDEHTTSVPYPPSFGLDPVDVSQDPIGGLPGIATLPNIHVARNFLHHNMRNDGGYGVGMNNSGGRLLIEGNTFSWNRHDITASGEPHSQYRASHNLVLEDAYKNYGGFFAPFVGRLQDFDVHGTSNSGNGLYFGGAGGYYVEIDGNTFLGGDGHDYVIRGYPVVRTNYHNNISRRSENDAIHFIHCITILGCINDYQASDFPIDISNSQFGQSTPDPTSTLGVGDFDGDGVQDLFLATGNTWFYSPGGQREWRYLNAAPDTIDQLLFGDFDGDGRTDVVAMRNGQLVVSWGGISAFDVLNPNPPANCGIADMAVGDFNGDGHPDIFCADWQKQIWWVSYGGNTTFMNVNTSSFKRTDLLFGDFDHSGTTDVFAPVFDNSNKLWWSITPSALGDWVHLQPALTRTVDGLVAADFDGDGFADIGTSCGSGCWQISYSGTQPWMPYHTLGSLSLVGGGVGHFSGAPGADILAWNGNAIWVVPEGFGVPYALSTQDMH